MEFSYYRYVHSYIYFVQQEYHTTLLMQGCPDAIDVPSLVVSSSQKIDLEHLMRDLHKYRQWLSAPAWEAWEGFMSTTAELDQLSAEPVDWVLPTLVSAAITASHTRMQPQLTPLSAEISQLVAKDTTVPTKVYFLHNFLFATYILILHQTHVQISVKHKSGTSTHQRPAGSGTVCEWYILC